MEKYFYLKADKQMAEGSTWSFIPKLLDEYGSPIKLMPTQTSIEDRHLVWKISDSEPNRVFIRRYYHNFRLLEEDPESKRKVKIEPIPVIENENIIEKEIEKIGGSEDESLTDIPTTPKEMEVLKAKIKAELDDAGIPYAKTSSLKILRELHKQAY